MRGQGGWRCPGVIVTLSLRFRGVVVTLSTLSRRCRDVRGEVGEVGEGGEGGEVAEGEWRQSVWSA